MSKSWGNFHFWVNYPFKFKRYIVYYPMLRINRFKLNFFLANTYLQYYKPHPQNWLRYKGGWTTLSVSQETVIGSSIAHTVTAEKRTYAWDRCKVECYIVLLSSISCWSDVWPLETQTIVLWDSFRSLFMPLCSLSLFAVLCVLCVHVN